MTTIQTHLEPGEAIIWQGAARTTRAQFVLFFVSLSIGAFVLWLGWSAGSPLGSPPPIWVKAAATFFGVPLLGFAGLLGADIANSKQTVLTDRRVLNVNRKGGVSPKMGYRFDLDRSLARSGDAPDTRIDVPTLRLEPSDPDRYAILGLDAQTVEQFETLWNALQASQKTSGTIE